MIWLVLACGSNGSEQKMEAPAAVTESTPEQRSKKSENATEPSKPTVILDGVSIAVEWDDGDTFHGKTADGTKIKARLAGYNTLESYGPVHQWGEWTEEMYAFAKESGVFASKQVWECADTKKGGGYGRVLVDCPVYVKQCWRMVLHIRFRLVVLHRKQTCRLCVLGWKVKRGFGGCTKISNHFFAFTG